MPQFYCSAKLSDRMSKTPEGFLVCRDVAITRTGTLDYIHHEVKDVAKGDSMITKIERTAEDVFDPDTIASFEGKSLTVNHPSIFVGPNNYRQLEVGTLHNVRKGEGSMADKLVTDIIVKDAAAIKKIESRELREVSCGYHAEYITVSPGFGRQTQIRGNHLALVPRGRAGPECAIFDSAPTIKGLNMSAKDRILKALGIALDSLPEDLEEETVDSLKLKLKKLGEEKAAAETQAKDAKATADKATADLAALTADKAKLTADLATVTADRDALKKPEPVADQKVTHDAAVISAAEILAPGIAKDAADIKVQALKTAHATADGKAVIDAMTGGAAPAYDNAAVVDLLFNGAAASLTNLRKGKLTGTPSKQTQTGDAQKGFVDSFNEEAAKMYQLPKL